MKTTIKIILGLIGAHLYFIGLDYRITVDYILDFIAFITKYSKIVIDFTKNLSDKIIKFIKSIIDK
jgi:hypothetical protein